MNILLGPLVQNAIKKEFPDKWISLANLSGLEYELNKDTKTIYIYVGNEEISITEEGSISTTTVVNTETITQIIIQALQKHKKEKEDK